jgi:hypothetical protein
MSGDLAASVVFHILISQRREAMDTHSCCFKHMMLLAGHQYDSPGSFTLFIKRLTNPSKDSSDGWRGVYVHGISLEDYRQRYLSHRVAGQRQGAMGTTAAFDVSGRGCKQDIMTP